jgi:hypothetical protein
MYNYFSPDDQLYEIKKQTLAKLVCENADDMPTTVSEVANMQNVNQLFFFLFDLNKFQ